LIGLALFLSMRCECLWLSSVRFITENIGN